MATTVEYNFTVNDTSPQILYQPPTNTQVGVNNIFNGWDLLFDLSGGFSNVSGEIGEGTSAHVTSLDGASFVIDFAGTGIELYGLSLNSSYTIVIDNNDSVTSPNVTSPNLSDALIEPAILASFSNLTFSNHTMTFTLNIPDPNNGNALLLFDRAVVTSVAEPVNGSVTTEFIDDTQLEFTGSWTFASDADILPSGNHTYHFTQTAGDQAEFTFQGTAVQLGGLINDTAGLYNISLTSEATSSIQQQFNGTASFLTPTTLFFASGLNPNVTHTLTVTNAEDRSLAVDGITVISTNDNISTPSATASSTSTRYPSGAIAAIAVASFLALVLIICLIAFLVWRRRCKIRHRQLIVAPHSPHRDIRKQEEVDVNPGLSISGRYGYGVEESESGHDHVPKYDTVYDDPALPQMAYATRFGTARHMYTAAPDRFSGAQVHIIAPTPTRAHPPVNALTPDNHPSRDVPSSTGEGELLSLPRSSPFDVDFIKHDGMSSSTGGKSSYRPFSMPPPTRVGGAKNKERDTLYSFLDFASSAASSIRERVRSRSNSQSATSSSPRSQPSSRRSRTSPGQPSLALSIDPGSQNSDPTVLALNTAQLSPRHPFSFAEAQMQNGTSPTESIPMTVSEINFRQEEDFARRSGEGRRASGSHLSHLPPHPPLPSSMTGSPERTATSVTFQSFGHGRDTSGNSGTVDFVRQPYIAQMLLGRRLAHAQAQAQARAQAQQGQAQASPTASESSRGSRSRTRGFMAFGIGKKG